MTAFQKRILDYLSTCPNKSAGVWEIAQKAFPEKWAKRSARGALVGHVDRSGSEITGVCRFIQGTDQWARPVLAIAHTAPKASV